ncbi:MAG: hypothetical protein ACREKS_18200 [Candidatus Rokuibacteriota bacterium]
MSSTRISRRLNGTGKTTAHTDTYHGRFLTLVPPADNEAGWREALVKLAALVEGVWTKT